MSLCVFAFAVFDRNDNIFQDDYFDDSYHQMRDLFYCIKNVEKSKQNALQ